MLRCVLIALTCLGLACEGDANEAASAATKVPAAQAKPKPKPKPEPEPVLTPVPIPVPVGDYLTQVKALPPIDFGPHANIDAARARNVAALSQHSKKEFTDSARGFIEAVHLDPGHVVARYNLACALAMESQDKAAFAVLDQLVDAGCPTCLAQVLVATRDADWGKYRADPRLKAVTARAKKRLASPRQAAAVVLAWLGGGLQDPAPPTFSARAKVKLKATRPGKREFVETSAATAQAKILGRWIDKEADYTTNGFDVSAFKIGACKEGCCETKLIDKREPVSHTMFVTDICFRVEAGRAAVLTSIDFYLD